MGSLAFAAAIQLMFMIAGQATWIQEHTMPEQGSGKIHGVVVYPEGVAFPSVGVTIKHQVTDTEYSVRANSEGAYDFTNVPSGSYNVLLQAPPTPVPFKRLMILSVEVVDGKTINLKSQMPVSDTWDPPEGAVMIQPRPTDGDIEGVVRDDFGVLIAGVDVTLVEPATNLVHRTRTDLEGRYRFIDLRPDKYQVRLSRERFRVSSVSAKVVAGKTTNLKTRLKVARPYLF